MSIEENEWRNAEIGTVFEDEVKDRKTKRQIFKTRQGKIPYVYDVKMDKEGTGFRCSDLEHAGIMSAIAVLSERIKRLENNGLLASKSSKAVVPETRKVVTSTARKIIVGGMNVVGKPE